ncbi:MAG: universal stress protein, partial [Pirellulales bacterium]|nr:universal stress protein [Pirellulales bacterium]
GDLAFEAVDQAVGMLEEGGIIDVIHVLPFMSAMAYGNLYGSVTDESRVEHVKKSLMERFPKSEYPSMIIHVCVGDPGREITQFAARENADLIVLPSHGYGVVKHLLLGSVAERVVRLAHCPVLVLRK